MSVDNFTICPKCHGIKIDEITKIEQETKRVKEMYGKVPPEEYLEAANALGELASKEFITKTETLAEYYEFYMTEDGDFNAKYKCICTSCGFKFEFNHKENAINSKKTS